MPNSIASWLYAAAVEVWMLRRHDRAALRAKLRSIDFRRNESLAPKIIGAETESCEERDSPPRDHAV